MGTETEHAAASPILLWKPGSLSKVDSAKLFAIAAAVGEGETATLRTTELVVAPTTGVCIAMDEVEPTGSTEAKSARTAACSDEDRVVALESV